VVVAGAAGSSKEQPPETAMRENSRNPH